MMFSIITIVYNGEKTIERTIKSVLAQTNRDFEYIIVDGLSTDSTVGIIKKYEPLFEGRMRWQSERDKGIYDAMNKGIRMASGGIIGIVNSDDWLEPDALDIVLRCYKANNCNNDTLYCGGINYHYLNGEVKKWMVNLTSFKIQAHLYVMAGIRHPAVFVPRGVYETIGLFNEEMHLSADQDFILKCYFKRIGFYNIECVLSNMSEGGLSTEGSERSKRLSEEDRKTMLKSFGKKGISYYWLWYSWKLRNLAGALIKK